MTPSEIAWDTTQPNNFGKRWRPPGGARKRAPIRGAGRRGRVLAHLRPFLAIGFDTVEGQTFWDHVEAKTEQEAGEKISSIRLRNYRFVGAVDAIELVEMTRLLGAATSESISADIGRIAQSYLAGEPDPEEEGGEGPEPEVSSAAVEDDFVPIVADEFGDEPLFS